MGNPALSYEHEPTPCSSCARRHGWGWHEGRPYTACERHAFFFKPDEGCKFWKESEVTQLQAARRVIVCGGRGYADVDREFAALDAARAKAPIWVIVQGGAPGADAIAKQWAKARGVLCEERGAQWEKFGSKAGPLRNQEMADAGADGLIALPGGRGTADMCRRAEAAGIPVWRPYG